MSAKEVVSHIQDVDQRTRNGDPVDAAERSINITALFRQYGWGSAVGPTPLPPEGLKKLLLQDRTTDKRWNDYFRTMQARHVGLYRSTGGFYWLLRFDAAIGEHWLEQIGTPMQTMERFGRTS